MFMPHPARLSSNELESPGYEDAFAARSPGFYETLLWGIMKNDSTLFAWADQVEAA